jgi:hypothetical protein
MPEGLTPEAVRSLELVLELQRERPAALLLADLPTEFLHDLARDPPGSLPVRLGAAVAVRAIRAARAADGPVRLPAAVDPADEELAREAIRLAALATVALTARTGIGRSGSNPELRGFVEQGEDEERLVDGFRLSEEEIMRRKGESIPYPVADFLADLWEVPERMLKPGPVIPQAVEPEEPSAYGFVPNHDDRVVKLYDCFRDKYGSPRGERRADLYLAVLGYLMRHREALEEAGEVSSAGDGTFRFREGFLDDLLARPPAWFE